jgi:hypothetical protein
MRRRYWPWVAAVFAGAAVASSWPHLASALRGWRATERQQALRALRAAVERGADAVDLAAFIEADAASNVRDDAELRALALAAEIGPRPPAAQQYALDVVAATRLRWSAPAVDAIAGSTSSGTRKWTSLGPLSARSEFNGTYFDGMDSGRPTAIAVHPNNPYQTFLATSGGGIWFADLGSSTPTWRAITDTLGSLAIGAIAIDPTFNASTGAVTLWAGLGDAFDQQSGLLVKGTYTPGDASGVFGGSIALSTASHPADLLPSAPLNIRQIRIDPANSAHLLVGTDDGLYTSADGGATFQLVDLPNDPSVGKTRESIWEIRYLGTGIGGSNWLISGVYACPTPAGATVANRPPAPGGGQVFCPDDANSAHYNKGDFWRSADGGVTWTSIRTAGGLPATVTGSLGTDVGRIAFATGSTVGNPATTVVYAMASTVQETTITNFTPATAAYLKSTDGGSTWTRIATGLTLASPATSATPVVNPTTASEAQSGCTTMNLGHLQSWYNLAVAVDPADSTRVLFGGDLCSAISSDGGATFRLASHWLPQSGLGTTGSGTLGYVHADWHAALIVRIAGQLPIILGGSDGGLFVSRDLFDVPTPELGSWAQPDVGLATHLFYAIGSGDPTLGDPNVLFGGLQDNGSRWRLVSDPTFLADVNPSAWDQVLGGDGIGAAVTSDSNGQNQVYWASVNGTRRFCLRRLWDCSTATRIENGVEVPNWKNPGSPGVPDPFFIRYDLLGDDSAAVTSASNESARIWTVDPVSTLPSTRVVAPGPFFVDGTARAIRGQGLRVSPYRYNIDGVPNSRIYGAALSSGNTGMGSILVYDKPTSGGIATTVLSLHGVSFPNVTGKGTGTIWIGNGSDFAAPQNAASLGGTDPKQAWLVASNAAMSTAVNCTNPTAANCDPAVIIPVSIGHLYKTTNGGSTWTPFHGNGTGFDLPNLPIFAVRYDPSDATDQTIWVGTEAGVYRTTDGGATWAPYGTGLPAVRVTDLRISRNGSVVRVSTYGRGVWEIYPNSEPAAGPGSGDFNRSKVIDFFNLASLAARLSATPSATNNLPYDSTVDMDGNSTLDDADIGALAAKFGSVLP